MSKKKKERNLEIAAEKSITFSDYATAVPSPD